VVFETSAYSRVRALISRWRLAEAGLAFQTSKKGGAFRAASNS